MKEYETDFSELMGKPNEQPQSQPQQPQPQVQQPYQPYYQQPYQQYQFYQQYQPYQNAPTYHPPVKQTEPKTKKKSSKTWLAILACSLAAAALATSVTGFLTANTLNVKWQAKYDTLVDAFDIKLEQLPYEHIRWVVSKDININEIIGTSDMKKIKDLKDNPLLLFANAWSPNMVLDRNPGLELSEFGTN